jgi:hypothetical protein
LEVGMDHSKPWKAWLARRLPNTASVQSAGSSNDERVDNQPLKG